MQHSETWQTGASSVAHLMTRTISASVTLQKCEYKHMLAAGEVAEGV